MNTWPDPDRVFDRTNPDYRVEPPAPIYCWLVLGADGRQVWVPAREVMDGTERGTVLFDFRKRTS